MQQQSCQSRRGRCLHGVCPLAFCPSGLKTLREHVLCFAQVPCQMPTDHRSWTGSEKLCRQTFSQCLDNETKPREGKRLVGIAQQVSGRPGLTGCGPRPFAFYLPASRGPSLKGISGGQASRDPPSLCTSHLEASSTSPSPGCSFPGFCLGWDVPFSERQPLTPRPKAPPHTACPRSPHFLVLRALISI